MSYDGFGIRALSWIGGLALGLALALGPVAAMATQAHSSPDDRARFVSITRKLEEAPLGPDARPDAAWAINWLTEAPDVTVHICLTTLGDMDKDYPYGPQIVGQDAFEMAALIIERPETANDEAALQLAGVTGALKTYRSILREKPDARSPALDSLLQAEARGELPAVVGKATTNCSTKK